MISGSVSAGCGEIGLILIVATGKTKTEVDRSFEPFPEVSVGGRYANHVELVYTRRVADHEISNVVRVRRQQAQDISDKLAVNQPDHERGFALESFNPGPVET